MNRVLQQRFNQISRQKNYLLTTRDVPAVRSDKYVISQHPVSNIQRSMSNSRMPSSTDKNALTERTLH